MSLTANFTRGCVLMEATVSSIREANNILSIIQQCNGSTLRAEGLYFAVIFTTDADADKFLARIKPFITETNNEHEKL